MLRRLRATMEQPDSYSLSREANRIFREVLLTDKRLQVPAKVVALAEKTSIDAHDTIDTAFLPVPFKFTESSAALWALAATFGNAIVQERFGISQTARVNTDVASLFLMSAVLATVDGKPLSDPDLASRYLKYDLGRSSDLYRRLCTNVYRTKDGRFFHLHGSMNADKSLAMIGLPRSDDILSSSSYEDVVRAYASKVAEFDADWLDSEANKYWRQAGVCLTEEEFRASAHGQAVRDDGLYLLQPSDVGTLPPVPYPKVDDGKRRPLEGLRLLDISRVIAAPTIAKLAALFGATVIRVSCTTQPDVGPLLVEGNLGKRDVSLDLKSETGRQTLRRLILDADIVLDGYRPGALERLGFGEAYMRTLARRRGRGVVVVRENCYGWHGAWASRAGWQQISDCVTGVAWGMGEFLGLEEPVVPPLPNSDYQTGIVGLLGILAAVDRRANEGGSYTVDVSLTQFNQFLLGLGKLPAEVQASLRALHPDFAPRHSDDMGALIAKYLRSAYQSTPTLFKPEYFDKKESNFQRPDGKLETLGFVTSPVKLEITALGYDIGSCFLGTYAPEWPS